MRSTTLGGLLLCCLSSTTTAFVLPKVQPLSLATTAARQQQGQLQQERRTASVQALGLARALTVLQDTEQSGEKAVSTDVPFELRGFSLATVGLGLGGIITIGSLAEYLVSSGSEGLSGVGFVYGIPILLIGLSLQYAQLNPVPVESTPEADRAYEAKSTDIIKKIKKDVTRHRYGDDAHLDTTVQALGLVMPNKEFPQLQYLKQGVENGELTFSMIFKSDDTPYRLWVEPDRIARYDKFFGPGVWSTVEKVDAERRLVAIKLITGERPASAVAPKQEEAAEAAATPASA